MTSVNNTSTTTGVGAYFEDGDCIIGHIFEHDSFIPDYPYGDPVRLTIQCEDNDDLSEPDKIDITSRFPSCNEPESDW